MFKSLITAIAAIIIAVGLGSPASATVVVPEPRDKCSNIEGFQHPKNPAYRSLGKSGRCKLI